MFYKLFIFLFMSYNLFACSIFHIKNNNTILVGRNFDYKQDNLHINYIHATKNSFARISISQQDSSMPYEGINSKGLFVAISAVPHTKTNILFFKPIVKSLEMVILF